IMQLFLVTVGVNNEEKVVHGQTVDCYKACGLTQKAIGALTHPQAMDFSLVVLVSLTLGSLVNAQSFGGFGSSSLMGAGGYPGLSGFPGGMTGLGQFGRPGAFSSFPSLGMGSLGGFGQGAMPGFGGFGGGMGMGPFMMGPGGFS
ncbi:hypothetical protein V3C99_000374, partial [Haemonchus contortus]|uniref:Glycine rich superfamily member n=1 Tax=Haemonchus contortus TaxID=6289 RepID=A0A7I4YHS5_HAECO